MANEHMTNEEIVREACRVIWTEHDLDRIPEFYSEDYTTDYPMTQMGNWPRRHSHPGNRTTHRIS